jgi:atypical dual specificity phosphatase
MNFSWVIPGVLAGSMGPVIDEELQYLKEKGIGAIVRLEQQTISGESAGLIDLAEFVPDFHATTIDQMDRIIAFIYEQVRQDKSVVVCCKAGMGRTGTVLACYLLHERYNAEDALVRVRSLRPGSVESPFQQEFVYRYEERLRQAPG